MVDRSLRDGVVESTLTAETDEMGRLTAAGAHIGPMRRFLAAGGQTRDVERGSIEPLIEAMLGRNQSLKGFSLLPLLSGEGVRRDLAGLFDLAAAGALTIVQGGRFSLHQAAQAHRALEERRVSGKVVLVP